MLLRFFIHRILIDLMKLLQAFRLADYSKPVSLFHNGVSLRHQRLISAAKKRNETAVGEPGFFKSLADHLFCVVISV